MGESVTSEFEHELLHVFSDADTGVTGAIAIHSNALGQAMGGLRLYRYASIDEGILDALRLSRAMSFKNSAAGLDLGGGKAVIFDDGAWGGRREQRMKAVGAAIEGLGGRYVTAEDVGTTPADMDAIAEITAHVAGRSISNGGRGDPSPYTARTVYGAIESAVRRRLGCADLEGIRVGVQGAGHVGTHLARMLASAGSRVSVTDIDPDRATRVANACGATPLPLEGFLIGDFDVISPCAMGGALGRAEAATLRAPIIAGAANNPLAERSLATDLDAAGVLYVPDFLANCGGIIHVGAEVLGLDDSDVERLVDEAIQRTDRLLGEALSTGTLPVVIAERFAQDRLARARGAAA